MHWSRACTLISANSLRRNMASIPNVVRLKELAKALNIPHEKVLKDITIRARKRFFCKYGDNYFQFASVKEILVPFDVALEYAASKNKSLSQLILAPSRAPKAPTDAKIPVVALLGHYNHGKTTLLDYFRGSNIVSIEEHGITQVFRFSLTLRHNTGIIGSPH